MIVMNQMSASSKTKRTRGGGGERASLVWNQIFR